MNPDQDEIPLVKLGQGRSDDDMDGGGIIVWGAVCLILAGMCFIAAACFMKAGAL